MFSGRFHYTAPPRRSLGSQEGVTLLEFLVGLVLFSLLVAVLSAAGKSVFKSWERGGNAVERQMDFWSGVRVMQRQIISTVAFRPGSGRMQEIAFGGGATSITLVTAQALDSRGLAGLWVARYELEPDQGGKFSCLTVRQWPAFSENWQEQAELRSERTTLLAGLEDAAFAFGSFDQVSQRWEYHATWPFSKDGRLPHVIRLKARVKGKIIALEFPIACAKT